MSKIYEFIKKYDILILIILGFLFYFPALSYGFVYDDIPFILNNQYINGNISINFFDFFIPNFVISSIYTPLNFIIYWGIIKIFGVSSFAFHFLNIFFYILSSIILYFILKRIIKNDLIAFFATFIYILHPSHIECTAWISGMGYNIAILFFFLSFLYFISALEDNKKINYLYSVVFYILAILSQPIAVTLPVILFLWAYCFKKERLKESIKYISAYIPFLLIYLYLYKQTVLMNGRFVVNYSFWDKLSFLGFDFFNSFIPFNLCLIKLQPSWFFIIPLFVFITLLIYFRKDKIILFFNLFGIIVILPYSNIFFSIDNPTVERYLLLFSVLSCVLISYFSFYVLEKFKDKSLIKYLSFIFFSGLYLLSFVFYLPVWQSDKTLWTYVYKMNVDNYDISAVYSKIFYSKILIEDGNYDEALIIINNIIDNNASYIDKYKFIDVYEFKILSLINTGKMEEAIQVCSDVEKKFPNNFRTYLYFFDIYMTLKNYDKAFDYFKLAEEKCKKANLYKNNDLFLLATKKIKLDIVFAQPDEFLESFRIISNNFNSLQDNGEFSKILEKNDYKSREEICLDYLKKYSDRYSQSLIFLLSCLYLQENYKENASTIMKFLLEEIDNAENFLKNGDNNSAEKIYLSVISKNKYMYEAYYNLGILYLQTNRPNEAKVILGKILEINPNDEQIKQIYFSL